MQLDSKVIIKLLNFIKWNKLNNFNIILSINGKKDVINISNFEITDYNEDVNDLIVIDNLETRGIFGFTLCVYLKEE